VQYLQKIIDHGILYCSTEDKLRIEGYCDADFASDPDNCRSTETYVFKVAGEAVGWASRVLPTVADKS
jgi:hypothetical protein